MSRVVVDDLDVKPYDKFHTVFVNHSFTIIAGSNQSGKTTLIKCLGGLILTQKKIMIQKTYLENINHKEIGKKIGLFLEPTGNCFLGRSVSEQLRIVLDSKGLDLLVAGKKFTDIVSKFSFQKFLKTDPNTLDTFGKIKLQLASILLLEPEILLLDDPTKRLTSTQRKEIISILNYYQTMGMTIIMTTSSLEDAVLANISKLCILHQGKFVLEGSKEEILKDDSTLSKVGLKIPFMVDLCVKLQYYNLVNEMILDEERLVEYLWK